MSKTRIAFALLFSLLCVEVSAQHFSPRDLTFREPPKGWADSVLAQLTLEEKVAQLMVVRVPKGMNEKKCGEFVESVIRRGVGGVCFFGGTAKEQALSTQRMQKAAVVPLMVCIDAEWGLGMRLADMFSFPRNERFGLADSIGQQTVYRMGEEVGSQCREMGIHVNFAPVVDINSNPNNPIIGSRAYGNEPGLVGLLGSLFMKGMQSRGVMAVAKHFPGHGDTDADSHKELPLLAHSRAEVEGSDILPFRRMISEGVGGVMVAHLQIPAYDAERPSSLSRVMVDSMLRREMDFQGLIFTDGMDMKGITLGYQPAEAALEAFKAGADVLLLPPDVEAAIESIVRAAKADKELLQKVDSHCLRVLQAKERFVVPTMKEEIRVPDAEHEVVCKDIVSDLTINTDRRIDSIVRVAIEAHAMPGCQVAVMRKGRIILERGYGHQMYDSTSAAITPETIYDLASLTKICATTLAVMRMVDQGEVSMNDPIGRYLPYLAGTGKERLTLKQIMSHCAGLQNYDALWKRTSNPDSLLLLVAQSPLGKVGHYCYSDFGFILLADMVRRISGMSIDEYVSTYFYEPMGLKNTGFVPLQRGVDSLRIAPTEVDSLRGLIRGIVHDPNANVLGGVAGHAGLFSNAHDVALLMQMILNGGELDGRRYLKEKTVDYFTRRHFEKQGNRRALGFDRQLLSPSPTGQTCPEAADASFGHTGFTGTMVWVDPEEEMVYVFLSNRVYPSASPNRLAQMNIRTKVQSVLYSDIQH